MSSVKRIISRTKLPAKRMLFARTVIAMWIVLFSTILVHVFATVQSPLVSADSLSPQLGKNMLLNSQPKTVSKQTLNTEKTGPVNVCTPAPKDMPTPLSLVGMPTTLQRQVDAPRQYEIYGDDSAAIREQIRKCGPMTSGQNEAEYAANTRYQLTWQYQYTTDQGMCKISQASVGIHVVRILPSWQPTASAKSTLKDKWLAFDAALSEHENGHAVLDIKYAQQLLDDLNQFPAVDCSLLEQSVKQLTDSTVSQLEQSNDNYDLSTNHGATQGAILP